MRNYDGPGFGGLLGCILFGMFTVLCFWRIIKSRQILNDIYDMKFLFHVVLALNGIFEFIFYLTNYLYHGYTPLGYASHLCGLLCNVFSFALVIYYWGSTIQYKNDFQRSKYIGIALTSINVLSTIAGIINLGIVGYKKFISSSSPAYILIVVVNGFSLFMLSCFLFLYGRMLQIRLTNRTTVWDRIENDRKLRSLRRINTVLAICSFCFLVRVVCLVGVLCDLTRNESTTDTVPLYIWFGCSSWIPTLGPGITLLVLMRIRKRDTTLIERKTDLFLPTDFRQSSLSSSPTRQSSLSSGPTKYETGGIMSRDMSNEMKQEISIESGLIEDEHYTSNYMRSQLSWTLSVDSYNDEGYQPPNLL